MARKRSKKETAAAVSSDGAGDPLAFMNEDKAALNRVRGALRALDRNKAVRARDVRSFINKVRKAVMGAAPAESAEPSPAQ